MMHQSGRTTNNRLNRLLAVLMIASLLAGMFPATALAAGTNNDTFTANSIPASMNAGQGYTVQITVKNTGTATWTAAGGYALACTVGAGSFGIKASCALPSSVKPNASVTFTVKMTAPLKKEQITSSWRMSKGSVKFGPTLSKSISVVIPSNNSQAVSATAPATVKSQQSYTLAVTYRNTGSVKWTSKGKYTLTVHIASSDPFYGASASDSIITLKSGETIAFGAIRKFTITNKKQNEGDYTYTFQMACDGKKFGAAVTKKVHLAYSSSQILSMAESLVSDAECSHLQSDVNNAQYWVNRLAAGSAKTSLQNRINALLSAMSGSTSKFVNLTWYIIGNGDEPDKAKVLKVVNDELKKKINANLDLRTINWSDYDSQMKLKIASGDDSYDLMFTAFWTVNYEQLVSSGCLRDMTGLLKKYGQDILKTCGANFLSGSQIGGKQFAVPSNRDKAHSWGALLLKSLVTKYNVDVSSLHTWADMVPVFDKIKAGEQDVWPLCVVQDESPFMTLDWDHMADEYTPGALDPNTESTVSKVVNNLIAQKSVDMYKMMRSWFNKGYINPDALTQYDYSSLMSTGKYFCVSSNLRPNTSDIMSAATNQQWVQVSFTPAVMSSNEALGSLTALPAAGKNPERAMMFLNLLYSDGYLLNLLDYGIKNVNYVVISGNMIDPTKGTDQTGSVPGYAPACK